MLTPSTGCTIFLFALLSAPIELDVLYLFSLLLLFILLWLYQERSLMCIPYTLHEYAYLFFLKANRLVLVFKLPK